MDYNYNGYDRGYTEPAMTSADYMNRTYRWMAVGLLITFAAAFVTAATPLLYVVNSLYLVFTIAELVLVYVLSSRVQNMSVGGARATFFAYALQCIGKEGSSCTAHRHVLHAGAEHIYQHQLCDGEHQIQRVDNVQQRGSGCNERRCKGDEQAYRHPAIGAVHIVSRGHGRLRVASIVTIVIVIHMGLLQSLSAGTLSPCSGLRNIVYCIEMNVS